MASKILLIENDADFAGEVSRSLESTGFDVRVTGDGKEGIELAREWAPSAIVLCVELPGMSGYLVCQKLKKDDTLRGIPLVLTSGEATEETFEKHRTLKARADEYLLKPYAPEALVEQLGRLVGLPEGAEEELVTLEEEAGFEAADGEPDREIPGLDLQSLPDDLGSPTHGGDDDEDLRLLDDAFDGLSSPKAPEDAAAALDDLEMEHPVPGEDVDAAADSLPEEDDGAARADLGALDEEADDALGALDDPEGLPPLEMDPPPVETIPPPQRRTVRGASADLLRAAGISMLDQGPATKSGPGRPAGGDADPAAVERLERTLADAREALSRAQADLSSRDEELGELRSELEGLSRRAKEAEADAARARSQAEAATAQARKAESDAREAKRATELSAAMEKELTEARRRLAEAERRATAAEDEAKRKAKEATGAAEAVARAEALEREIDELRTELIVARGEVEGVRGEVEKRTEDLRKRLADAEAQGAKNEERVVKAYQKIKADEKVREKVRKALAIAMQLLDDGLAAESPAEKERRAGTLMGRE